MKKQLIIIALLLWCSMTKSFFYRETFYNGCDQKKIGDQKSLSLFLLREFGYEMGMKIHAKYLPNTSNYLPDEKVEVCSVLTQDLTISIQISAQSNACYVSYCCLYDDERWQSFYRTFESFIKPSYTFIVKSYQKN